MVFLYGVSLVDPMILRSGHFFRTPTTSAARWTGRGPWPNASAGCVQSWNFTMTCSWQLWQVFCKKIEGRCQIPFVRKCHWDFEILQWLEAFPCFFQPIHINSQQFWHSFYSFYISSTSVSTGGQGDPLEVGTTHGSRSRPGPMSILAS